MFGSKNRARIAELELMVTADGQLIAARDASLGTARETIGVLREEIESLRTTNYALDRTAAKYKQERDKLTVELLPFLERRAAATRNLKQFQPKANGADSQGVVS